MDVISSAPPSSAEVEEFVKDGIVGAMVKQCQQFAKKQQLPVHMLTNQEQQTGQRSHTGTTVAVVAPEHDVRQRTVTFRILGFTQRRIAEEFAVGLVQFKQEVSKYASVITYLHKEITSTDTGVELCVMFVYDHQRLYDTIYSQKKYYQYQYQMRQPMMTSSNTNGYTMYRSGYYYQYQYYNLNGNNGVLYSLAAGYLGNNGNKNTRYRNIIVMILLVLLVFYAIVFVARQLRGSIRRV